MFSLIELDKLIDSLPKVSGGGNNISHLILIEPFRRLQEIASEFKDEFISIEHLLLGILTVNDAASRLLKSNGVNEKDLKSAIKQLRKGSTVNSQTAEETYNALNKYAFNLNDMAKKGKT